MKRESYLLSGIKIVLFFAVLSFFFSSTVSADRFSSSNYTIDTSIIGGSIAGEQSSSNYTLSSSGGESVIGNGSGGSYALGSGYVNSLDKSLQLDLQPGGQLAYYSFDNSVSETIFDQSATELNLAVSGTPAKTTGKIGDALQTSDNNSAESGSATAIDTGTITVEAWLKYDDWAVSTNSVAVARWDSTTTTNGSWRLGRSGGQQFRFSVYMNNTVYTASSSTGKNASQWYHVVGTYDGTTARIYVDGTFEGQATVSQGNLTASGTPLSVGEYASNADPYWAGAIDEIKIFNRAFSSREIRAQYSAQSSGYSAGLSLGAVTPGTSNTATADVMVRTDAPGYSLALSQDHDLQTTAATTALDFNETFNSLTAGTDVTAAVTNFTNLFTNGSPTFTATSGGINGVFDRITIPATSSSGSYRYQLSGATPSSYYLRTYIRVSALPGSNLTILNILDNSTATLGNIQLLPTGALRLRNLSTTVATTTNTIPLNTWVRVEWRYSLASGNQTLGFYDGANVHGLTPTETISGAAQTVGPISYFLVGVTTAQTNMTLDIDEIATSTAGYPDPVGSTVAIPAISGSISTPQTWSESSTKGLGFTLYGTNATALPGKWSSGSAYAALPNSGTTFYSRTSYTGGVRDVLNMRLRLDVANNQQVGDYANTMIVTGTMTP